MKGVTCPLLERRKKKFEMRFKKRESQMIIKKKKKVLLVTGSVSTCHSAAHRTFILTTFLAKLVIELPEDRNFKNRVPRKTHLKFAVKESQRFRGWWNSVEQQFSVLEKSSQNAVMNKLINWKTQFSISSTILVSLKSFICTLGLLVLTHIAYLD